MADQPLKRAVITEELVSITDDIKHAIVLRQLLYWLPRTRYVDSYIEEERERNPDTDVQATNGWVYKASKEMAKETMIGSPRTARRCLGALVESGYVDQRENPQNPWDKTLQYRVNVTQIEQALQGRGYTLKTVVGNDWPVYKSALSDDVPNSQDVAPNKRDVDTSEQNGASYTETTTETTTHRESASAKKDNPPPEPNANNVPNEQSTPTDTAPKRNQLEPPTEDSPERERLDKLQRIADGKVERKALEARAEEVGTAWPVALYALAFPGTDVHYHSAERWETFVSDPATWADTLIMWVTSDYMPTSFRRIEDAYKERAEERPSTTNAVPAQSYGLGDPLS